MSNINNIKSCFGQYENWDNSWHCKGCIVSDECKECSSARKQEETNEQSQ